ncbi:GatB/YqeY domain-containing protein [Elioraea sp.]|uniref:GatB/YqeY domain-containing protein n=1 Tax=Elioraea sp. TaxID=2185103 RepID=UPI0025BD5942|nr:GatB/YqeY domain-containing protein [Elioraea sp.]
MGLREQFTEAMKASMKAGDAATTSTVRMIIAKMKDTDIATRDLTNADAPQQAGDEAIVGMLRGMVKSRRESITLYRQGNREDLAAKEEAEIAVITRFLPPEMDEAGMQAAVAAAVAESGAASVKDMGKVMAALKAKHGATLDMGKAGPLVKAALAG